MTFGLETGDIGFLSDELLRWVVPSVGMVSPCAVSTTVLRELVAKGFVDGSVVDESSTGAETRLGFYHPVRSYFIHKRRTAHR